MAAKRIGRVSVARVTDEWETTQALNPRTLAFEMADALRSMSQPGAAVPRDKALVVGVASDDGADQLTWHALADYFDGFGSGTHPTRILTLRGDCQPSALLLDRAWLEMLTEEAVTRAEIAAGYAHALYSTSTITGATVPAHQQPTTLSGSAPECLEIREAQQRREGEASATERLDAALIARDHATAKAKQLGTEIAIIEAQLRQALDDSESMRRELIEERRERTKLAEQQREYAGIIEFMNQENPLSPLEGRRAVTAWCELTENGAVNPVTEKGVGMGELARRWWAGHFGEPPKIVAKHLQWALTWPARKKGGSVSRRPLQNG